MPPHSRGRSTALEQPENPGAGTRWVYSSTPTVVDTSGSSGPGRGGGGWPPTWADIVSPQTQGQDRGRAGGGAQTQEKERDGSPDTLLERGVAEYSFIPTSSGGILGRGKFSTVYKVQGSAGEMFALKHTPLHPHHPLIAARLLREPTLLAQLPPHPCLIGVEGWVRTPGHFYLIEQLASSHVPLPAHPLPLSPSRAAYILDQLVSVIRDCLHGGGRVCHRDLKGENVLVDPETGNVLIIDLGLATHFSMSEPKLTTCCGSPAFHSPEIVHALNHQPGAVTYYGPELDIWCIALTLLSLLTSTRFPLGPSHSSLPQMAARVTERLEILDKTYPPSAPWVVMKRILSPAEKSVEGEEWKRVRAAMSDFLQIDGTKRMAAFSRYAVGNALETRLAEFKAGRAEDGGFKQVSFIPSEVKYTLPLYLSPTPPTADGSGKEGESVIVLDNAHREVEKRIMSYLKYLLRTAGILYHVLPTPSPAAPGVDYPTFQLALPLPISITPPAEIPPPVHTPAKADEGWLSSLFRRNNRSASLPPKPRIVPTPLPDTAAGAGKVGEEWIMCYAKVTFHYPRRRPGTDGERRTVSTGGPSTSRSRKGRSSSTATATAPTSPTLDDALTLPPLTLEPSRPRRPGMRHTETSPDLLTSATLSGAAAALRTHRRPSPSRSASAKARGGSAHPHLFSPLSRQVSLEQDADADDEKDAAANAKAKATRGSISGASGTGTSTPPSKPGSRAPSRGGSRVGSRAGSRVPSRAESRKSVDVGVGGLQIKTDETPLPQISASPEDTLAPLPSPPLPLETAGERKVSSKSEIIMPLPVRRRSSRRPAPTTGGAPAGPQAQVRIHLSDPRALPVIRKALDVTHATPSLADAKRLPAFTPRVPDLRLPEGDDDDDAPLPGALHEEAAAHEGNGIPIRKTVAARAIDEEPEPERGRPRSKEDRSGQSAGSSGSPANKLRAMPVGASSPVGGMPIGTGVSTKRSMTTDGARNLQSREVSDAARRDRDRWAS